MKTRLVAAAAILLCLGGVASAHRLDEYLQATMILVEKDRVQAHILVCFLAFVLWKCLEMWQQRAGLGNSPRTILEELARIQSNDVVLPTTTHGQIRLRCITQPDTAQVALLDRLGIALPKRMRLAEHELPALAHTA